MVVIFSDIRSVHNVGSMFRTADAAGISKIYLTGITAEPTDRFGKILPQFNKVALGAEKSVPWEKVKSASHLITALKKDGFTICAVEQASNSVPYTSARNVDMNKLALIMGNEVMGLSKHILKKSDIILEIPMRGKKESLNVSVAFGIVAFGLIYS